MKRPRSSIVLGPLAVVAGLASARWLDGPSSFVVFTAAVLGLYALLGSWLLRTARGARAGHDPRATRHLVLLTSSGLALSLLLGAVALRGRYQRSHSRDDPRVQRHDELGWAPAPTEAERARDQDLDTTVGQHFERVDPARTHVVVMGDSVLWGWGVEHEEAAASLASRRIASSQVLNASVSGYGLPQYLLYLERILPRLRPRLVVLGIFSGNDFASLKRDNWYGRTQPFFAPRGDDVALVRASTPFFNCVDVLASSALFKLLWDHLSTDRWTSMARAQALLDFICDADRLDDAQAERVVRGLTRRVEALARARGARLLVLILPDRLHLEDPERGAPSDHARLARAVRAGGFDAHLFREDVLAEVARSARGREAALDALYIEGDNAHFSAAGNRLLADVLVREMTARGVR
jgi:lysophospholipase L1-like esterase